MEYRRTYEDWLNNDYFDEATKEELRSIASDENEIKERFYTDLAFGTAGLRGIIGSGTNRMNIYTVRKATQGLANYILKVGAADRGVAIAYDSRNMSPEFADEAALCLNANGINEVALMNGNTSAAKCLAYAQITPAVNVTSADSLQIDWQITVSGS